MRLPRFWARAHVERQHPDTGLSTQTTALGWSDTSIEHARDEARKRANRVLEWLLSDGEGATPEHYPYTSERPLREERIRAIDFDGESVGVVTRNRYGALILNAEHVMFIDVDDPPKPTFLERCLARLTGRTPAEPLAALRAGLLGVPGIGARIYRTARGYRAIVTSQLVDPCAPETQSLMAACNADPEYRLLCAAQQCFRARLTPKPWRCQLSRPPQQFPFDTPAARSAMQAWIASYESLAQAYAVCELVERIGSPNVDPAVAVVLREHDQACLRPGHPLA